MKRVLSRVLLFVVTLSLPLPLFADHIDVCWPLSDKDNLSTCNPTTGAEAYITPSFTLGSKLTATAVMTNSGAESGYSAVTYDPPFVQLTPSTRVTSKTAGHSVTFTLKPTAGHTFKPTLIEFDAVKCGTDGGNFDVYIKNAAGAETALATAVAPLRNKISSTNATGFSHHSYMLSDVLVESGKNFQLILYVYNFNGQDNENPKSICFRNVTIGGESDEPIFDASHYFTAASCSAGNLLEAIGALKNGDTATWPDKLIGDPTDFSVTAADGYTATVSYDNKIATFTAYKDGQAVFTVSLRFVVTNRPPKPAATPLNRGLMAVKVTGGVLVSWRYRATDDPATTRFRLYRGSTLIKNSATLDGTITTRTNWLDTAGSTSSAYKLEVLDADGNVIETQEGVKPWSDQVKYITLQGGAPVDPTSAGATYTPNDASFCDMDGDGEYEIILKWAPNNEKDAASSGTTSPAFYSCYKMDGTRLWMLHTGHNMFNSAHTTPFIAWDLDGDGYGEFMVKTAPGAVDGEGNYVLMAGDDPTANLKSGRGKQDHGPEYITVFDGMTGAELQTIKYHTAYGDESTGFWGDSNQNRSERYLAAIAWLDGEDGNPSAIFARGYYSGCKIGAYDWDGSNLTLRWLHRGTAANSGTVTYADGTVKNLSKSVYGEGAHWISIGDVTGDGRQEIHYGSGALKPDGTTLYRTGFGHGDAIHLSDFIPSRPGLEYFMVHEHSPYGADLRDAATGEILFRVTADSDTGRGLIGHFNPEADDAYWQMSANMSAIYDTSNNLIANNVSHGGGASLNNRIFWNGTLADDYYDKSVLEYWNVDSKGFARMQVNGGNYTYGNLNNSTKYNPCVLGDLLGDWREEIVNWTEAGGNYQLVINATNYETDYLVPHLMDNYAYRAQVINQNCAYNQPPHLSYDLIAAYTRQLTIPDEGWALFYTPYPVYVPEDVKAYKVTGVNRTTQILNKSVIPAGSTLPAGSAVVIKGTPGQTVNFRPSTKAPVSVSAAYLKGDRVSQKLTASNANTRFYQLQPSPEDPNLLVFSLVENGTLQPAATPWLQVTSTQSDLDTVYLDAELLPDGISLPTAPLSRQGEVSTLYDISGRQVTETSPLRKGVYIQDGRKMVIK